MSGGCNAALAVAQAFGQNRPYRHRQRQSNGWLAIGQLGEAQGVKLTFLPFVVKAVVAALKKHAVLNSALDESTNELVYRKYYNIGMAASTDAGLMVPVIKDADRKSILEVASEIDRLGSDAKAGRLKAEDLQGSTFTITSLGALRVYIPTPE